MPKIPKTLKETALVLGVICVLLVPLTLDNLGPLKGMYLRHLLAKEKDLDAQSRSLPHCANWAAEMDTMPKEQAYAAMKCEHDNYNNSIKLLSKAISVHNERLYLEVKWDMAVSDADANELGWNHAKPEWNGQDWACPSGTELRSVPAAKEAGATEYMRCFPKENAPERR